MKLSYINFGRKLWHRYYLYKKYKCKPLWATFDITWKCFSSCEYCPNLTVEKEYTPLKDIKTILFRLREAGVVYVGISGGEPLLRRDIPEVISYAKSLGFVIGINTSGIPHNKKIYKTLLEAGLDSISFSLDGATPDVHEIHRKGCPFDEVIEGIRLMVKLKEELNSDVRISTSTVVTKSNAFQIEAISELRQKLGAGRNNFQPVWNIDSRANFKERFGLVDADRNFLENIRERLNKIPGANIEEFNSLIPSFYGDKKKLKGYECFAGRAFVYVDPEGNIYPCSLVDVPLASLLESDWKKRLNDGENIPKLKNLSKQSCGGCSLICYMERNIILNSLFSPKKIWSILKKRY